MSELCWAQQLITFHEMKKSNAVIKKDLVVRKALLQARYNKDDDDKDLVPPAKVVSTPAFVSPNTVTIENDDNNLKNEQAEYINALINSNP